MNISVSTKHIFDVRLHVERKEIKVHQEPCHERVNQDASRRGLLRHDGNEWHIKRLADKHIGHVVRRRCTHDQGDQDGEQHQLDFHGNHGIGYSNHIFFLRVFSIFFII